MVIEMDLHIQHEYNGLDIINIRKEIIATMKKEKNNRKKKVLVIHWYLSWVGTSLPKEQPGINP